MAVRRFLCFALAATLATGLGGAFSTAAANPANSGEFAVPTGLDTNAQIAAGTDGNMWVTSPGSVVRITPDGTVTPFTDAATLAGPVGIAVGPDGFMWVTAIGKVVRFSPANPLGTLSVVPLAGMTDPRAITLGPDGQLWTASGNVVYRLTPTIPSLVTPFAATGVVGARWIAAASDGTLWVADFGGQQLVNVTTAGVGTAYPTAGGPQGVVAGLGAQAAYSDPGTNPQTIGRVSPGSAVVTTQTPMADPFGVTYGPDGAYWFGNFAGNTLGRLTPDGVYTTPMTFAAGSGPRHLAAGPGNTLWVVLDTVDKVAKVSGVMAPAPTPTVSTPAPPMEPTVAPTATPTGIPGQPIAPAIVTVKSRQGKIKVSIPTSCAAQFKFRLQKARVRHGDLKWHNSGKLHATKGTAHTRTVNPKKGIYRVIIRAKCGFAETVSAPVRLKR
ncbi:MAG: virginiamycin B lyase family protein [Candidatus Nanopelagicales bacterium]